MPRMSKWGSALKRRISFASSAAAAASSTVMPNRKGPTLSSGVARHTGRACPPVCRARDDSIPRTSFLLLIVRRHGLPGWWAAEEVGPHLPILWNAAAPRPTRIGLVVEHRRREPSTVAMEDPHSSTHVGRRVPARLCGGSSRYTPRPRSDGQLPSHLDAPADL